MRTNYGICIRVWVYRPMLRYICYYSTLMTAFLQVRSAKKLSFSSMVRLSFVQPLSLTSFDSSPGRGASGETVHFAGTAKASPTRSNGDDRRQWRKQGGAVGAAASRMRATAKQTLGAATRAVASRSDDGEVVHLQQLLSKRTKSPRISAGGLKSLMLFYQTG